MTATPPPSKKTDDKVRTWVYLPKGMITQLQLTAAHYLVSTSELVEQILDGFLTAERDVAQSVAQKGTSAPSGNSDRNE